MNIIYITGSSRGIGKALAKKFLQNDDNLVYGLSRNNSIIHRNFSHVEINLSDIEELNNFDFLNHENAKQIILINNAGVLGPVASAGKQQNSLVAETFIVNSIAPAILTNKFIAKFVDNVGQKIILNTSSGAGRHTVKSWSVYCASKAALDMMSMVIADEQKDKENPVIIFSVAPGVVDTKMQDEIRMQEIDNFPDLPKFIDYKQNNILSSADEVADKYLYIIENVYKFNNPIIDVRSI